MTTINIFLPEDLEAFVDEQVAQGSHSTVSDYIRHLLHQDQKRAAKEQLEALLLEGLDSGEPIEVTNEWWEQKRAELVKRQRQSQA